MTDPFTEQAARFRREIHVHCYRMLGSFHEAEDLVQDTYLRAWQARDSYDPSTGASGLRTWLYRIATNACLDLLRSKPRRVAASGSFAEVPWLEPYPDRLLDELPAPERPDTTLASRETIALGYLALIQLLPARQRAVLMLHDILDWSAAEIASFLDTSVAATNSALQRARATMQRAGGTPSAEPSERERSLLAAFIDAHERGDTAASVALMHEDIRVTMPPRPQCFEGIAELAPLVERATAMGTWRLVPAWANRQPAAVSYLRKHGDTVFRAFKIDVLHITGNRIREITTFEGRLVELFGLASELADSSTRYP
jgi:RNA polymerase sigma-70 factor (ECF subfamily)